MRELREGDDGALQNDEELQAIEGEINQHEQEMDEATRRMLRMAQSTVNTGAATLEQLHGQGEQLKRIEADQGRIQHNLDASNKILKGMTSFMGWRAWGAKPAPKSEQGAYRSNYAEDGTQDFRPDISDGPGGGGGGGYSGGMGRAGGGARGGCGGGGELTAEQEQAMMAGDPMAHINSLVDQMQSQALAINGELKSQAAAIEKVTDTTERHQAQTAKATKQTASVGGRGAKKAVKAGTAEAALGMAARAAGDTGVAARRRAWRR